MLVATPKESWAGELRAALVPAGVKKLVGAGLEVAVEAGAGAAAGYPDSEYISAGATIAGDRAELLSSADVLLRVRKPEAAETGLLKPGCVHISFLDPFNEKPLVASLAERGVTLVSMEMIPRTTKAQKMDALSSQANLAGYVTVVLAAHHSRKIFPMMMTPAGTIAPSRVFVIGAGVAGLQAIATAKRLGARVDAFDTRPVVAEQVRSLGARFVEIDLGEIGQTEQGYARELTPEQLEMQKEGQKQVIARSDVVITTAQVFGRAAPRIVTADMVAAMRPGSVVVDMAVESGGNVEGSVLNEVVDVGGVKIVGLGNLPSDVSRHASDMYSANLVNLIEEFWDADEKTLKLDPDNEIAAGCVIARDGRIVNETIANL
ncbi:MAG: NAD(P) transhydrogenase subunit alpha [Gammaproteobacteria bacterium]|nr:NAD(P) transhydrogenase subunit alpha [Gammaproteobacteria bacterium]